MIFIPQKIALRSQDQTAFKAFTHTVEKYVIMHFQTASFWKLQTLKDRLFHLSPKALNKLKIAQMVNKGS